MKVFFIIPDVKGIVDKPTSPHIGTAYLASYLLRDNHEVKILDMRLGYDGSNLLEKLNEFKPDLVCFTMVSMQYKDAYYLVAKAKDAGFKVIVGGPHPSTIGKKILEETNADMAVIGEGENTIAELCSGKELKDIGGLIWRDKDKIVINPPRGVIKDLDKMPYPAFELFELDRYIDKKLPLVTSRSCPYNCTYCSIRLTMGGGYRARSPENVVDEIEYWNKRLGYNYFEVNDDCFNLNIERAEKICDLIIERGLKIKWSLRNGIRVDRVSEQLFRKMKQAGCFYVAFGVESAVQEVIDLMKKNITPEKAENAIRLAEKVGLKKGAFFIIGLPGDTYERFRYSLNFALKLPLDEVRFYNAIPFPGTELYEWINKNGKFIHQPEYYLNNIGSFDNEPIFETKEFSFEQRKKAIIEAENLVMKYLIKTEFGNVLGTIGYLSWRPKLTRNIVMKLGKKVWSTKRKLQRN